MRSVGNRFNPEKVQTAIIDPETGMARIFEIYPDNIGASELDHFLLSAVLAGASDITIQAGEFPKFDVHGRKYYDGHRHWSGPEVFEALSEVYGGANLTSEILGRKIMDISHELPRADGTRQRFRVNMTGIGSREGHGVEATFRAMPVTTPTLDGVGVSGDMAKAMQPMDGMVLIGGSTGSGKSTTMAALNGDSFLSKDRPVKIVDLQAPIEYAFTDIRDANPRSILGQSEVGKHIVSFAEGVRSALRRNPDIITVGESRDYETISASLEASLTGHTVYTTTHANSVAEAISRLRSAFRPEEQEVRALDIVTTLRFVMVQYLVPRRDRPGRVAVREYLKITDRVRRKLIAAKGAEWSIIINDEVDGRVSNRGPDDMQQSLIHETQRLFDEGVISHIDGRRLAEARNASLKQIGDLK